MRIINQTIHPYGIKSLTTAHFQRLWRSLLMKKLPVETTVAQLTIFDRNEIKSIESSKRIYNGNVMGTATSMTQLYFITITINGPFPFFRI